MRCSGYLSKSPIVADGEEWWGRSKTVTSIRGLRHLLCRSRSEDGQSLVEFAFVAVIFLSLVFAIFDFGRLFFVKIEVENAIQEAARFGSTGNHLPDPSHPGNDLSRVDSIISTLKSAVIGVTFASIQVSSAKGGAGSAGASRDMVTVAATVNLPLMTPLVSKLFPGGQYTFTERVTVMNEPFPDSQVN